MFALVSFLELYASLDLEFCLCHIFSNLDYIILEVGSRQREVEDNKYHLFFACLNGSTRESLGN